MKKKQDVAKESGKTDGGIHEPVEGSSEQGHRSCKSNEDKGIIYLLDRQAGYLAYNSDVLAVVQVDLGI